MSSPKNGHELPEPDSGFPGWNPDPVVQPGEQARELLLMQYFDGELDAAAAEELEAELSDDELQQLDGLSLSEQLLCESIEEDSRGDAISGLVMAALAQDATASPKPLAKVEAMSAMGRHSESTTRRSPANDNARSIWALAAAAAAVAAGLFVWGKTEPVGALSAARVALPASAQAVQGSVARATAKAETSAKQLAAKGDDDASNVEVDFGSHRGSVFLVGSGNSSAAMSAVVWVTDGDDR
jgi:hypothetical protein